MSSLVRSFVVVLGCLFCLIGLSGIDDVLAQSPPVRIEPVGEIITVGEGFEFTEGPAWAPKHQAVFFTDIPNASIHRMDRDGKITALTKQSAHANGMIFAADGRLLACQMDGDVVAYDVETGKVEVLANQFEGVRFNAPNDLVIDSVGGIYFTDPKFRAPVPLPQKIQAVYYRAADGVVSRVTGDIAAPNGIALSPDGKQLYVAPSLQSEMLVYDVHAPGKLSPGRTLCKITQPEVMPVGEISNGADGMAVDVKGNLYYTTVVGVEIFSPTGDQVGLIKFPRKTTNVTFAGEDRKTMVVTSFDKVYQVKMPIAGWPSH